ncbi:hypothetical protein ABPG74_000150 [Tetrahymena malaccensis]
MSYSNLKSELSYRSGSVQKSQSRLRSQSSNIQEGLSSITHVNGTSNPQRVIELNVNLKENPAKYRIKQEYMEKYRNMLGLSTLQVKEKEPRDLKVRIQDVEHIIDSTNKIENAHKRLNQKVEDIILANQPYCPAKIEFIQETDEKIFYQVNRQPRAKENNVIMNNPVFNTLYDDVMQNKAIAQDIMRSINESNPQNPFRDKHINNIQNSTNCPQKYKEKLLEPIQRYLKHSQQQNENNLNDSQEQSLEKSINKFHNPIVELPSVIYKYHNEENFNKIKSRKSYQSGKPFYGTATGNNGFYKLGNKINKSLNQTFDESLTRVQSSYQGSSSYASNKQDQSNSKEKQLFKVQHVNKLNAQSTKPNFYDKLNSYSKMPYQDRDLKLYFYETYSQQNSPFRNSELRNNQNRSFSKDPKASDEYKKQANINYYEKQANQYHTYKQRIPKLSVNVYAVENKNTSHLYLHPKDEEQLQQKQQL